MRQAWQCAACKTLRIYGSFCAPDAREAVIRCAKCERLRRHTYSHHTFEDFGMPPADWLTREIPDSKAN